MGSVSVIKLSFFFIQVLLKTLTEEFFNNCTFVQQLQAIVQETYHSRISISKKLVKFRMTTIE